MRRQTCKIYDLKVDFGVTVPFNAGCLALLHPDVKDIIPAVQKHILSFFHTSVPSRLDIMIDDLDSLPKIEGVEESTLMGDNLEGTSLERFFRSYPNQKRFKILSETIKNIEESSQLFDFDCLYFEHARTIAPMALKHFKGSHLYLLNAELKMEDVMQFFQRWKSGEGHQNLEYLYITLQSGQFQPEAEIQLDAKPNEQTNRPMIFRRSPKVLEWLLSSCMTKPLNCEGLSDIEREDGRLASIQIRSDFLRVCVWTDSQFEMDNDA